MKQDAVITEHDKVYQCIHCSGIAIISVLRHTEKGTWPEIEFCPFCGSTNMYPAESANKKA